MNESLTSFYFPHDYNARNDERLLMLRSEHGLESYAVFWMILESMAAASTGEINRVAIGGLSIGYGVAKERLTAIIDYCITIGLFKERQDGAIYSTRMKAHLAHRQVLKDAGKRGAEKRWSQRQKNSHPNAKERRGEERREEKRKEDTAVSHVFVQHARLLAGFIRKDNPAFQQKNPIDDEPTIQRWAEDIEKIVRLDHATEDQVEFVIRWIFENQSKDAVFWRRNILSGKKLREQFVRIVGQVKSAVQSGPKVVHI